MADTIQLKLLENKTVIAEINGKSYAYEGGYRLVAGEKGATQFEIVSIPKQYDTFKIEVEMTNAQGEPVTSEVKNNRQWDLPKQMAVAGYGSMCIKAVREIDDTVVVWIPLKLKIWDNDWKPNVKAPALVTVGKTITNSPESQAKVTNVGTDKYVVLDFEIPQGNSGVTVPSSGMFIIWQDKLSGKIYVDYPDDSNPPIFEFNKNTGKIYYIIGE